jgi:8-oxo-dGTP diphosphatase
MTASFGGAARFVVAVVVLVFRSGRLLAMRRSRRRDAAPGAWEALAGRVRKGEQPLDAARREAAEECSLRVDIDPRPVTAYQAKRGTASMVVVAYRGMSRAGEVALSDEHDAYAWMTIEEFARACRFDRLVKAARLAARLTQQRRP